MIVKAYNKTEKPLEEAPAVPAAPTQEELLTEIRDLLKKYLTIIVLGAILLACSTEQTIKTENKMEPRILAIGRLQSTLDILVEECPTAETLLPAIQKI